MADRQPKDSLWFLNLHCDGSGIFHDIAFVLMSKSITTVTEKPKSEKSAHNVYVQCHMTLIDVFPKD